MNIVQRTIAGSAAAALVAVPAAVFVAAPASADADREKEGPCAGGQYELSVDREDNGWEIEASLDDAKPGQKWKVKLWQNGNRYFAGTRTTDREGDLDVERFRKNTSGSDRFRVKFKRVSDGRTCGATVTVG